MWHFFDHEGKEEWIYVLESLVQVVNQSINRTIGVAPKDVTKENEDLVFTKLYGHSHKIRWPTFKVGDLVLLSKYASPWGDQSKKLFKKGYKANFTKESFVISKVDRGDPNLYSLVDQESNDEPILGGFYSQELTASS